MDLTSRPPPSLSKSFSPCFNDLIFVSGCQTILALVCLFRFYMQCSSGFEKFRFKGFSAHVHYAQMLCCFALTAIPALQLAGQLGALTGASVPSSSDSMPGFEVLAYGISLLSWFLCSIVFCSERSSFERDGQWLIKFACLLVSTACRLFHQWIAQPKGCLRGPRW